jgi:hypothetical protein
MTPNYFKDHVDTTIQDLIDEIKALENEVIELEKEKLILLDNQRKAFYAGHAAQHSTNRLRTWLNYQATLSK